MEIKKCERCGCFYASLEPVCSNCTTKDKLEISKLQQYFSNTTYARTINDISANTGISTKNLNRYLSNSELSSIINSKDKIKLL